ncbi:hypothetical protein SCACP_07980 [Sporomusa carbonis]|uniref:hypothetical protein n=1 Tax=Sporomusa carbonis TaxID=3076075 RepID=UPI003A640934
MFSFDISLLMGISVVLALVTTVIIKSYNPQFGEVLGMQMIFPILAICICAILGIAFSAFKLFFGVGGKKNQGRTLKAKKNNKKS